jgi:DNA adenine methylase
MPLTTNPLRYPGAKRTLVDYIDNLLFANNLYNCCFYEPYAGSAAVGIELLKRESIDSLVLCEKDILLYAFWKCVFNKTGSLCDIIQETPITIQTWKKLGIYRETTSVRNSNLLYLGFAGLFFNRTNFSGILNANPIGGIDQKSQYDISCRFNKEKIINLIKNLSKYKDMVKIYFDDAINFMHSQHLIFLQKNCFAYFDPPYYDKGPQIYRHYYTNQDHVVLSKYIKSLKHIDWIISYDDAPFICNLYGNGKNKYRPFFIDYSCAAKKRAKGNELLISNLPLPPFPMAKAVDL